jgi:outer membrane protein assembly factor BamE (lipoprotein component of BamABCDE complex)
MSTSRKISWMNWLGALALLLAVAACHTPVAPQVLSEWQGRTLYTCCNIHYEGEKITDVNHAVGAILPFGSPVTVTTMTNDSVTFSSGATTLTLYQSYGKQQESAQQYFSKVLVETDPRIAFATFPKQVQEAITDGRVERGMTKEQVIMSLGYPPTHRTASTDANTWVYWYNRWVTYQVQFGADGKVSNVVGSPAPTRNEPIVAASPTPAPAARPGRRKGRY